MTFWIPLLPAPFSPLVEALPFVVCSILVVSICIYSLRCNRVLSSHFPWLFNSIVLPITYNRTRVYDNSHVGLGSNRPFVFYYCSDTGQQLKLELCLCICCEDRSRTGNCKALGKRTTLLKNTLSNLNGSRPCHFSTNTQEEK